MVVEKNPTPSRAIHNPEKISREAPYSKYGGAPDKRKLVTVSEYFVLPFSKF